MIWYAEKQITIGTYDRPDDRWIKKRMPENSPTLQVGAWYSVSISYNIDIACMGYI